MLRLSTVLVSPGLGLTRVGPATGADPEVKWAHVSELPDPTPWLAGNELLLTTGMDLFRDDAATDAYCARLAAAGVAALGLSTGASLPHPQMPPRLPAAAENAGLELVHVPESTPLQAVVRRVSDALNEEQMEPLRRALLAQRQLSEAATGPDGVTAVLQALAANTTITAAVYDPTLQRLTSTGAAAEAQFASRRSEISARTLEGLRWTIADDRAAESTVVAPLGSQGRLRGVMIAVKSGAMTTYDRALLAMVFSLLSVLLELRHSSTYQQRRARDRAVDALLAGNLTEVEATVRLARAGVECSALQAVALPAALGEPRVTSLVSQLQGECTDVLARERTDEWVLLLCDPEPGVAALLSDLIGRSGAGPAGIGTEVSPERAALSLRQARRAQALAASRKVECVVLPDSAGYRAMLMLGDAAERGSFADTVLAPLDEQDARGNSDLVQALHAYLENTSNVEAAATQLGVHRHTMRARLAKIAELTQRDLANSADLLELWLACEFRALAREAS
ncbi:PucR family transcriptional regulator [Arthrobacter sp. CAU 1506]|uniref:helix-turn-helix domain-containing protein n=1 Tax=Arthrobacter sp. CAU 1506 TaxID=2560052 RepID=UPI0010ACF70C|nr:PucR family transcriptional regulator [Arthrobacter sp. CAU 1506]TJY69661.1 PucR family transcriptional regulator [Arthrobacter sp. CAU 1506]